MAYKVINEFKDKDGHIYTAGDTYPDKGKATKKRLDELSRVNRKYKVAFIEKIKEEKEPPKKD